ncbi:hypothetical protein TARUN_827 [Trichoderma arundinaceum]|uniref:Uncharacterized protein n=1 Tax=Trichoderma arundinaceum TaxID=490622 RepID=A0A395NZ60_TRIAR|nr:hypothetical protein TARUN_827 [Trichoderma arundinaceum]
MASESIVEAELINDFNPEDPLPQNTVTIKFNVKGGGDRTERAIINTTYTLKGQPNIQGITIWSSTNVVLYLYGSSNGTGTPERVIEGPTGSEHKFTPVTFGDPVLNGSEDLQRQ